MIQLAVRRFPFMLAVVVLAACGGGGDDGTSSPVTAAPAPPPAYVAGTYLPSSTFAARCVSPRSGTDPLTGRAYADVRGSVAWENSFLRSWSRELYLWYRELPDINPASVSTPTGYFNFLRTSALTASGKLKDEFHFTYPTTEYIALSQSGVSVGYGVEWVVSGTPPSRVVIAAYTEPNSPARAANITRGARLLSVDGTNVANSSSAPLGLYPVAAGENHRFVLRDLNGTQRDFNMTSVNVTSSPVQNVSVIPVGGSNVGYLLFNDHNATSEQQLITAFTQLRNANVSDLVLDIRYNGGGYLDIASEVAYMIAGGAATMGRTFERIQFNDQHPSINPVTRQTITPIPFYSTAVGFSAAPGTPLPTLNLPRVFLLTGTNTCSASESIINSLTGIGLQVIQIGSTTCGKPYGFYPQDNCGTTYFTIQFQGVNNANFGSYSDGFSPNNTVSNAGVRLPG